MTLTYSTEDAIAAGKTVLLSFILYMIDPFSLLFTVPIHVRGLSSSKREVLLLSGLGVALVIALRELVRYRGIDVDQTVLVFFTIGFGFPVMLSLMSTVFYLLKPLMAIKRLGIVFAASTLTGLILVAVFRSRSELVQQTTALLAQSLEAFGLAGGEGTMFSSKMLAEAAVYSFIRVFSVMLLIQFGIGYGLAWEYVKRKKGTDACLLDRITLPEWFVWVLIGSWTVVLFDIIFGLGFIGVTGWNIALPAALMYVLRGLALFRRITSRRRRIPFTGFQLALLLLMLMFIPGLNMIVLVALGILGVSEIWIVYRNE